MQAVDVRAADADRERVLAQLERHTVAGRLSMDEFSERAAAVYRSRTVGELAALTADLPPAPAPIARDGMRIARAAGLTLASVAAAATLVGLAATTHAGAMMSALGCG